MNNLSKVAILAAMASCHGLIYFMNTSDRKGSDKHSQLTLNDTLLKASDAGRIPIYGDRLWGGNATGHVSSDETQGLVQQVAVKGDEFTGNLIKSRRAASVSKVYPHDEDVHLVAVKTLPKTKSKFSNSTDDGNDSASAQPFFGVKKTRFSHKPVLLSHGDIISDSAAPRDSRRMRVAAREAERVSRLDKYLRLSGFETPRAPRASQTPQNLRARNKNSLISGDVFDPDIKKMKEGALRGNRENRQPHEQRQSTHTTETHDSITNSIHRLMERYSDTLYSGDIFDYVREEMMRAYPDDLQFEYVEAMGEARRVFGEDYGLIESLVLINPYDRDEADDSDTRLNAHLQVIVRALNGQKDKIDLARKIARLHASQDILFNALKMIGQMRGNSEYQEKFTQIGYDYALRLFVAALEDKDLSHEGWRVFVERMARAANEYRPDVTVCAAGGFNAIFETLDGVHDDVKIIPSFKLMMQSISSVEDDGEFLRLASNALRLVEPNPEREDYDEVMGHYMGTILAFYRERPSQLDSEGQELASLRRSLLSGMSLDDGEFENLQSELVANLPSTVRPVLMHAAIRQVQEERNTHRRALGLRRSPDSEEVNSVN